VALDFPRTFFFFAFFFWTLHKNHAGVESSLIDRAFPPRHFFFHFTPALPSSLRFRCGSPIEAFSARKNYPPAGAETIPRRAPVGGNLGLVLGKTFPQHLFPPPFVHGRACSFYARGVFHFCPKHTFQFHGCPCICFGLWVVFFFLLFPWRLSPRPDPNPAFPLLEVPPRHTIANSPRSKAFPPKAGKNPLEYFP